MFDFKIQKKDIEEIKKKIIKFFPKISTKFDSKLKKYVLKYYNNILIFS